MDIKRLKVQDLHITAVNVRKHPQKQLDEMIRSYRKHGQYRPLVVAADGECIVGNGFLEAMKQAGVDEVDCIVLPEGTTDADKKKLLLSDNKIFDLGADNLGNIDGILMSLDDFDIPGYDESVLAQLYAPIAEAASAPVLANGTVSDTRREQILEEERRRAENPRDDDPAKYEVKVSVMQDREGNEGRDDSYITCPHCGLKIYGYKRS